LATTRCGQQSGGARRGITVLTGATAAIIPDARRVRHSLFGKNGTASTRLFYI
jgi:hypothetical protein